MLRVKTAATTEPVSVAEAKANMWVMHAEDDAMIESKIRAARDHLEQVLGRALADAEFVYVGTLPGLPIWPGTIQSIAGLEDDGFTWTTLAVDEDYNYNADANRIVGSDYCTHRIEFAALPGEVPQAVRDAILLRVQAEYEGDPVEAEKMRAAAYDMAFPYRTSVMA